MKETNTKPVLNNLDISDTQTVSTNNSLKFEDYVVRDQVFEAIVTDELDDNDMTFDAEDHYIVANRTKTSDTSQSLMSELKVALKSKASEHKRREAQALGIPVNENNEENSDEETTELKSSVAQESKQRYSANSFYGNEVMSGHKSFGFESQLAAIAAQRASLFATNAQTESFGDESDDELCE